MADEPTTRVGSIVRRIDQIDRTFAAAGVDPADAESRERFGDEHRKLRELLDRKERRTKWLATAAATIAAGIVTALSVSLGPLLFKILAQGLVGK